MRVVPPRQVAVIHLANYDQICASAGKDACNATMDALRQMAVGCGVDPGYMRASDKQTLLLRLDDLPREEFLQAVECMSGKSQGLRVDGLQDVPLLVRVGAMSERALRSVVNDTANDLIAYMNNMDVASAFLTGDERDIWQKFEDMGTEFLSHEQLKHMDPFTGLLTMDRFFVLLQEVMDNRANYDGDVSVLYFDIDDFKSYNRTFDHAQGDELLLFVARTLRKEFPGDVVSHLSIDRFAVLTNLDDIARKCATVHEATKAFRESFAPEIKCGIFVLEDGLPSAQAALDCAKLACESIKGRYDMAYRLFGPELRERLFTRRYVAHHAEQAVEERWIQAFAQPVVSTSTGDVCGFEALARWIDPERGILSPAVFIPTLEDAHLIHKLDICIVDEVCQHLSERREQGLPVVPASVNLSRLDFQLCDVVDLVQQTCARWHIPHDLLAIEITESALDGSTSLRQVMDNFRAAGFEVWMDDFGCGYSSLNLLKDYDFDVLKVDMEFLRDLEVNQRSKTIVSSVIRMAQSLGVRTLVEGVETKTQYEFLREAGCDMMQGYLFGKPLPLDSRDF